MVSPIHILHIDDNTEILELTRIFLKQENSRFQFISVTTAQEGFMYYTNNDIDCILSDYHMPGMDGLELLEKIREENQRIPFIIYTGDVSKELTNKAISKGADDCFTKNGGKEYTELSTKIIDTVHKQ